MYLYLSIYLSIDLSIYLSIDLSIYIYIYTHTHTYIYRRRRAAAACRRATTPAAVALRAYLGKASRVNPYTYISRVNTYT